MVWRARYTVASPIVSPTWRSSEWIWAAVRNSSVFASKARTAARCHVLRVLMLVINILRAMHAGEFPPTTWLGGPSCQIESNPT